MITLDTTSIEAPHDEVYSVERGSRVKVFIDGYELKNCVYCNVSKGVAICVKRDLSGQMMVAQDKIVHELVFGVVTVKSMDTDNAKRETHP